MDRAADLRADYDRLGELIATASRLDGSAVASWVRERRIIGELLEGLEAPVEVSKVDELADKRRARSKAPRAASRRRKSG